MIQPRCLSSAWACQTTENGGSWYNAHKYGSAQGPEIRTGFLKDAKPIQLTTGKEITITTDYEAKGDSETIAVRSALALQHNKLLSGCGHT